MPVFDKVILVPPTNWNFYQEFLEHVVPIHSRSSQRHLWRAAEFVWSELRRIGTQIVDRVIWRTTNSRRKHLGMTGIYREEVKIDSFIHARVIQH